eukprot:UC1_evm1s2161
MATTSAAGGDVSSIKRLLRTINRYDPGNLGVFVNYVRETTEKGTYDLEAYLAVLKLYQFKHAKFDVETTRAILLKAMTAMPSNDFSLCLGLLSTAQQDHAQIQPLVYMADLLETCMFPEFWSYIEENPQLTEVKFLVNNAEGGDEGAAETEATEDGDAKHKTTTQVAKFKESIRTYVAHVINITYQRVEKRLITEMTGGVAGEELEAFIATQGWTSEDADTVFVAKQEDTVTSKEITEDIQFKSLVPLIASSLAAK